MDIYTVQVHREPGHELWAEVAELPGSYASGATMSELWQALGEAISLITEPPEVGAEDHGAQGD